MSILPITEYVRLVQMNTARTEHVLRQIGPLADDYGDDFLAGLVEDGLVTCFEVNDLATRRRTQSEARSDDGEDEFDKVADADMRRLLKGIRDTNEWMRRTRHSLRTRVAQLVQRHCPVGPGDIISQRYEEQLHRTRALIADLRGPSADLIGPLEIEQKLRAVEASVVPYEEALSARRHISGADVRARASVMHEKTAVLVAYIIGAYASQPSRMQALLLPVADQQARIRAILKARRTGQQSGDDPSRDDDDLFIDGGLDDELDGPLDAAMADEMGGADAPAADAPAADAGAGLDGGAADGAGMGADDMDAGANADGIGGADMDPDAMADGAPANAPLRPNANINLPPLVPRGDG